MDVRFNDDGLDELESNAKAKPKFPTGVIKAYRKRLWQIRAAHDERDFRANRGFKLLLRRSVHLAATFCTVNPKGWE